MTEKLGNCALCTTEKLLEKSHIIPNASFKKLKRNNAGKAVVFDYKKDTLIRYEISSWWEYLLCGKCEDIISEYERYFFSALRGKGGVKLNYHQLGLTFQNLNYSKFKLFLTSLLWRAGVSKQPVFSKVSLSEKYLEEARLSLLYNSPLGAMKLGCKISALYDPTPENGFTPETIKQFIISPIPRIYNREISFLFCIEGFLIEFYFPHIPFKKRMERGVYKNNSIFMVPYISIFDIPELSLLMVEAYRKNEEGQITF